MLFLLFINTLNEMTTFRPSTKPSGLEGLMEGHRKVVQALASWMKHQNASAPGMARPRAKRARSAIGQALSAVRRSAQATLWRLPLSVTWVVRAVGLWTCHHIQ